MTGTLAGLTGNELLLLVAALVAAGLITGFMSGLLGIGGGGVLVPVLYETFTAIGIDPAIRMHMALGTSLLAISFTTYKSFSTHRARGAVDMDVLRRFAPWVIAGVIAGIWIADRSSTTALKWFWVVFGSVMVAKMTFGRDDWRLGHAIPAGIGPNLYAAFTGLVSVLLSIGGGAFFVTLLTVYGRPLLRAVATSSGFGPIIAIPGALGFMWAGLDAAGRPPFSLGYASLVGAAIIIPAGYLTAPLGVRLAHGIQKRTLELAFASFLALVVVRFLVSLLAG
jgi:uncharacterized membrane protein YfcA